MSASREEAAMGGGLVFERIVPEGAGPETPLVVLLHGRGSDRFDLMGIAPHLAADAVVVCPQAPFPGEPWGYGPGSAWYRFVGRNRPDPASFEASQNALAAFLANLPAALGFPTGTLVLGGFSQGGTMSVAYALRNPGAAPIVLNFSGFLADHPSVAARSDTVGTTRFFWGHGTADPSIPYDLAVEGRAALKEAGAYLESRDYRMGHGISPEELTDARTWLSAALDATTPAQGSNNGARR